MPDRRVWVSLLVFHYLPASPMTQQCWTNTPKVLDAWLCRSHDARASGDDGPCCQQPGQALLQAWERGQFCWDCGGVKVWTALQVACRAEHNQLRSNLRMASHAGLVWSVSRFLANKGQTWSAWNLAQSQTLPFAFLSVMLVCQVNSAFCVCVAEDILRYWSEGRATRLQGPSLIPLLVKNSNATCTCLVNICL